MTVPQWVAELAGQFWQAAGPAEPFPRSLRRPLARALPLAVVLLPGLCLDAVRAWLQQHAPACACTGDVRVLRACLFAWRGTGFIFLDGTDSDDEQRFSLAHELAHFLRDYWQPRRLACRQLGDQIIAVLDGQRPPTPTERLHALRTRVPLGCHFHLMERADNGRISTADVALAEEEADRLAYELLAPAAVVTVHLKEVYEGEPDRSLLVQILRADFGLPAAQAQAYGHLLQPDVPPDPLLERLRRRN